MSELAGPPSEPIAVPRLVLDMLEAQGLDDAIPQPVWQNSVGGVTFSVGRDGKSSFFVKHNPPGSGESLANEAERLRWIAGKHPAPEVVALETSGGHEVLLTRALPGTSAVAGEWKKQPSVAIRALGEGLRRLHELPVEECPYDWGVAHRARADRISQEALAALGEPPPIDRLVVCQGDPCAPNTLIADDGSFLAHVDLARLGTADRWADLAVMTLSLEWNYVGYNEADFWAAYGSEPDAHRIAYYRALWNAAYR